MVKYWTLSPLFEEKSENVSFNFLFIIVTEVLARDKEAWKVNKKHKNWKERNSVYTIGVMRVYVQNTKEGTKKKKHSIKI